MAASRLPNSPRINFRLAEVAMSEPGFDPRLLQQAKNHAILATDYSPWDYRLWHLLSMAQEANSEMEEAEKSQRTAVKLAPNFVEVNWSLANLLLREGKLRESLDPFRVAVRGNMELLPTAYELIWQASNGDLDYLRFLAAGEVEPMLRLTQFLAERSQTDAAVGIFREIEAKEKVKSPSAASFITALIAANKLTVARELWLDSIEGVEKEGTGNLIWNGSFEADLMKVFNHFDWTITNSNYARIGIDSSVAHSGGKSLKLIFAGRDTTKLEGEIKQLLVLKPNTKYRLECYAKAANLVTPEGPRLALLNRTGEAAVSAAVMGGTTDWQNLLLDFTSPLEPTTMYVTLVRIPRFAYDEPTRGTVWFDDFKLTEL